jgi:hypothetical protein
LSHPFVFVFVSCFSFFLQYLLLICWIHIHKFEDKDVNLQRFLVDNAKECINEI